MAVTTTFAGFSPDGIQFMADLAANNDRAWFQPRKADYERLVKEPMELLMVALARAIRRPRLPLVADPKRSPFRIYRDTRFSSDKSPYKTHIGASLPWVGGADGTMPTPGEAAEGDDGPHGNGAYFNFQPGEMYAGGGHVDAGEAEARRVPAGVRGRPGPRPARRSTTRVPRVLRRRHSHETLKRVPPGFPADHPEAERLRWKDVVFGRRLTDDEVCSPDLPDLLTDGYARAVPVFRFLAGLA